MTWVGTTRGRVTAGLGVVALVVVLVPTLRPLAMLVSLVGLVVFGIVTSIGNAQRNARRWEERLASSASAGPDRLELAYAGDLLEPEWPLRVEVNEHTRQVTVDRAVGIARKVAQRTYAFEEVSHLRYERQGGEAVSMSLVLNDGTRVPLAKIDPQRGKRRPSHVVLREPERPELILDGVDEHSQFVAQRLRKLIGVGSSRPLPEDLGFAEPSATCRSCNRSVPPNQQRCTYCGGSLSTSEEPAVAAPVPIVYEIP